MVRWLKNSNAYAGTCHCLRHCLRRLLGRIDKCQPPCIPTGPWAISPSLPYNLVKYLPDQHLNGTFTVCCNQKWLIIFARFMITSSVRFAKIAGPAASCACPVMEGSSRWFSISYRKYLQNEIQFWPKWDLLKTKLKMLTFSILKSRYFNTRESLRISSWDDWKSHRRRCCHVNSIRDIDCFEFWAISEFSVWKSEPSRSFDTWSRFRANLTLSHLKI